MKSARKRDVQEDDATSKKQRTRHRSDTVTEKVDSALRKIRSYIGVPAKFNKAARLVLSLCHEGHITTASSSLFFQILMIAMMDKDASLATEHRKGYCKLVSEAVKSAALFTSSQRKMLEVYQIWTVCRSELNTDDSFVFGKNMSKLREMALQLPACAEKEDAIMLRWKQRMDHVKEYYRKHRRELEACTDEDLPPELTLEWDEEECLVARREAIVDWLEASKDMYRHQWACTAVDMSIHVLNKNKDKFCKEHRERIEKLLNFSKDQKLRRQQGPSMKEKRRDVTAFEEARIEWSKEKVSNRGMVGASGDHKAEAWLG